MKFKKKPVVIEAVCFNGSSTHRWQIESWIAGDRDCPSSVGGFHTCDICSFAIDTLEGEMLVSPGDFVIKGVAGEFYPCKPDIFAATYEALEKEE